MKSQSRSVVRHRISARVTPAFYNRFCTAMKVLSVSQQDMIVRALEAEFTRVNLRKQCQLLTHANAALTEKKEQLTQERNGFREEIKQIAKCLGVPDTARTLCAVDR